MAVENGIFGATRDTVAQLGRTSVTASYNPRWETFPILRPAFLYLFLFPLKYNGKLFVFETPRLHSCYSYHPDPRLLKGLSFLTTPPSFLPSWPHTPSWPSPRLPSSPPSSSPHPLPTPPTLHCQHARATRSSSCTACSAPPPPGARQPTFRFGTTTPLSLLLPAAVDSRGAENMCLYSSLALYRSASCGCFNT